ncbi:ABC transporter substrate-binding protein [Conexibacter sp. JD483]|uniref:ABC transporter substrate-binding protein n=1 Tax=unclassified Conexibacter TaxID=2627773 RepID=UPI002726D633|nr:MULTISPECIES: ABC transporter substrate-binding protein [unclassified Conexibacter]MDO8187692.1 ABC transporter substrate-binding protein [Conexibacter sp. CPCC 205706]MDO8199877.1 ABC transporter substrate-binding protein [Conexibacter sp. CPCC 205762]MDR9372236.1 ABC transporter substrate-binding protein [Conexibacter sp. JD483]
MKAHPGAVLSRSRKALAIAAALALSVGVAACGSSDGDGAGSGGSSTTAAAGGDGATGGAPSGNLRVVLAAPPSGLDPIVSARDGQYVWGTMLEPLVSVDDAEQPTREGLITDWSRPNPTTWELTVRPDVSFTNGEPFDAAAAAFAIRENVENPAGILKSYFANVRSVRADGDRVVVTTRRPQVNLVDLLTTVFALPPRYYGEQGSEGFTKAPIGTGPFTWTRELPGRSIQVSANPDYWGEEPGVREITFTWATDAQQRLSLLQSGAADVSFDLPPTQAKSAADAGLDVTEIPTAVKITGFLQADRAPFDDVNVRRAAQLAIDRDALVESIFQGRATATGGMLNMLPDQQPAEQVTPNADEAKALLRGQSPSIELTYPTKYTNIQDVAEATAGMLEEAGFRVRLTAVDYGTLVGRVVRRQIDGMYLLGAVPNVAHPDFFAHGFMTSTSITANCPDRELDVLTERALVQPDAEAAQPIYDELNTRAVVEDACYAPLYNQTFNIGSKGVRGLQYSPLNVPDFDRVTLG